MKHKLTFLFFCLTLSFGMAQNKKDYSNGVPITKGTWFSSLSLSANSRTGENDRQLFATYIEQQRNGFNLRVDPGYVIKDNLGIGIGLLYGSRKDESIQQSSDGVISNVNSAERKFEIRPYVKNFIPLGESNRFYIVIPTELQIGFGNGIQETTTDGVLTREFTDGIYYGLGMRPGMLVFIHENFGFEVNVGALGISRTIITSEATGLPDSKVNSGDLSLKINLLELSLGFSIYL
ncbi:MAG: hypothetical protein EP311_04080 [Cytophagales bacterium]|nr:MAG: hypothetical protein EP311_04080 [Cytophagales bacterium]